MADFFSERTKPKEDTIRRSGSEAPKPRDLSSGEDERTRAWVNSFDGTIANMEQIDYWTTVLVETRIITA